GSGPRSAGSIHRFASSPLDLQTGLNVDDSAMTTEISTDTDSPAHAPVVVIGLGAMGRALAGKLLGAGHPTTVWNRSPDKARPLVERGARPADSIEGALQAAPLVITCLTSTDVVADLLDQVTTSLSGRTLINLSSGTS